MTFRSVQRTFLKSKALNDPDGHFAIVDDIQTFYKIVTPKKTEQKHDDDVSSQKPVILCLHQIYGNLYTWKDLMQPLADATGCHVIAYDRIPFGFTEKPLQWEEGRNPYKQEAMCEFTLKFLSCLGYANKKVVFIGCSAGASISCYTSIKHPDLSFALILIGAALRPRDQGPPQLACKILGSCVGSLILKTITSKFVKPLYKPQLTFQNAHQSCALLFRNFTPLEILPNKDILQKLPILYIVGKEDDYTSYEAHKQVFEEIKSGSSPDSVLEFRAIEECGHVPQDENPQEILKLTIGFLNKLGI